MNKKSA